MKKWLVWLSRINFIGICWFAVSVLFEFFKSLIGGGFSTPEVTLLEGIFATSSFMVVCVLLGIPMFYLGWRIK